MDEVDFGIAYRMLRKNIDDDKTKEALIVIMAMLDGLNQRITEMQEEEQEDC